MGWVGPGGGGVAGRVELGSLDGWGRVGVWCRRGGGGVAGQVEVGWRAGWAGGWTGMGRP